jgi:hypothetical protein
MSSRDWEIVDEKRGHASRGVYIADRAPSNMERAIKRFLPSGGVIVSFRSFRCRARAARLIPFRVGARFSFRSDPSATPVSDPAVMRG